MERTVGHLGFSLPQLIDEGERNDTLYRYGCSCWAQSKTGDPDELCEKLHEANSQRCVPPLASSEVEGIAQSVMQYEHGLSPEYAAKVETNLARKATPKAQDRTSSTDVNDKELSRLFAKQHGDRLRFVEDRGMFHAYDEQRGVWAEDPSEARAHALVKRFIDERMFTSVTLKDEEVKKNYQSRLSAYAAHGKRAALVKDVRSELLASSKDFDACRNVFHVQNGTLRFDELGVPEFYPHDPSDMLTKTAGCSYDDKADQTPWVNFLAETFEGDAGVMGYIQQLVGLALVGDTSREKFYMAYGQPRTGKSTFCETLCRMFGDYACTLQPEVLQRCQRDGSRASPEIARLKGARLVICRELPSDMALDSALVKQLTGNDTISARNLYAGLMEFRPEFSIWLNTNYLPTIHDMTVFASNRVEVVPFDRRPTNLDSTLKDRLSRADVLSGLLNWAIAGLRTARLDGISTPEPVYLAVKEYEGESDKIGLFLDERTYHEESAYVRLTDLFDAYQRWCQDSEVAAKPRAAFKAELQNRGHRLYASARVHGREAPIKNVFKGLGLRA